MKSRELGKSILDNASIVSLALLLIVGTVQKDMRMVWSSTLMISWKTSRRATQELLSPAIVETKDQLIVAQQENNVLREADRILYQKGMEQQSEIEQLKGAKELAAKLESELNELDLVNERLNTQLATHRDVETEKLNLLRSEVFKLENKLSEAKRNFEQRLKQAFEAEDKTAQELAEAKATIVILQDRIAQLLAPRRITEAAWYKQFCNGVADWMGEVGYPVHLNAALDSDGVITMTVEPLRLSDLPVLETLRSKMFYHFKLPVKPGFELGVHDAKIHILDKAKAKERKFFVPEETWFEDLLVREKNGRMTTYGGRFVGESESGKSTALANAIGCVKERVPDVEFIIADPLFYVGDSDWQGHEVTHRNDEECYEGLKSFYQLFKDIKDNKAPKSHTRVFVLDEFDTMMADHSDLRDMVRALWKQGRHAETYLWVSGQSPLVQLFDLKRDDVQNVFGVYLGTTVPRSFADCFITGEESVKWLYEYNERKKAGEQFLAFIRPKNGNAFMTQTPMPGAYTGKGLEVHSGAIPDSLFDPDSLEFNLDQARKSLEAAADMDSGQLEKLRILNLHSKGKKPHEIIMSIWGLEPKRSKAYREKKALVQQVITESSENP